MMRHVAVLGAGTMGHGIAHAAMMAGYEKLSVADLREIVASVLFARGGDDPSGSRSMLNSGDTIH